MTDIKNEIDAESAYDHSDAYIANYLMGYARQDFNEIVSKLEFDDELGADWSEEANGVRFTITLTTDIVDKDLALRILEQSRLDDLDRPDPSWTNDEEMSAWATARRLRA